jgi:hypothetical protein
MGHRVVAGLVPAIHVIQRTERPKASNKAKALRLRGRLNAKLVSVAGSWMAGTSSAKPGHDAPSAQRRDRHRRRPTLKAMTAACYAPDNWHYRPVAFLFTSLFQRMKMLSYSIDSNNFLRLRLAEAGGWPPVFACYGKKSLGV